MQRFMRANGKCPRTGKVRWKDHASAARAMNKIRHEHPEREELPVRVYQCVPGCRGWHLTHEEG